MHRCFKYMGRLLIVLIIMTYLGQVVYAKDLKRIETKGVSIEAIENKEVEGFVILEGTTEKDQIKILVKRGDSKTWYDVEVKEGKFNKEIWFTQGIGTYDVAIMIHKYDRKYSYGPRLIVKNIKEVNKYLVPSKYIENNHKDIMDKAQEITKDHITDLDKARAIYDWVIKNISYDYKKYDNHQNNNYDNKYGALNTLTTQKGVCYDYATLTAALGRAAGIQVKVIEGIGKTKLYEGLHAWNEIYLADEDKWIKVDTTFGDTGGRDYFDNEDFDDNHIKREEY